MIDKPNFVKDMYMIINWKKVAHRLRIAKIEKIEYKHYVLGSRKNNRLI